jgi:hypothetical protein
MGPTPARRPTPRLATIQEEDSEEECLSPSTCRPVIQELSGDSSEEEEEDLLGEVPEEVDALLEDLDEAVIEAVELNCATKDLVAIIAAALNAVKDAGQRGSKKSQQ